MKETKQSPEHPSQISPPYCHYFWVGVMVPCSFLFVFFGAMVSHSYPSCVAEVGLTFLGYYADFLLSFALQKHLFF